MTDSVEYCREIESYLCRKNGGHLVRIVGPAFEKVLDWSKQGVPLKVAFRGIDRCCDRAAARGGRRRPLRIEFCEADVLQAFDDWRRALGVTASQVAESPAEGEWDGASAKKGSLASHIERSVSRLLAVRNGADATFDAVVHRIVAELDGFAASARKVRGTARDEMIVRLASLDAELVAAARACVDPGTASALRAEAEAELAGFIGRMNADAARRARELAFDRLLRESFNLPVLAFD